MPKSLLIFLIRKLSISLCLGIVDTLFVIGFR
jgi:hypothetical protein